MNDLMTQLSDARPTQGDLDAIWSFRQRQAVRDRVMASAPQGRAGRRPALIGVVAASVMGAIVIPAFVGPDRAAAQADLLELAENLESGSWQAMAPGKLLHVRSESVEQNSEVFGDGRTVRTNREKWVRWDGQQWAIDTRPDAGYSEYHVFNRPETPSINGPTPEFAAALPDEEDELRAYLQDRVSGSSSHDEAMFVAITDLAYSSFLPPSTLAAALRVLADVGGVETKDVTIDGQPAVEISYSHRWSGLLGRQSMTLDRETAQVLSQTDSDPSGSYELTTTLIEIVDTIPTDARQKFATTDNGERVYD